MIRNTFSRSSALLRRNFGAQAQMTDFEFIMLRWRFCWHRWDRNGDGRLTRDEFLTTAREISEKCNIPFEGRNEQGTNAIWDAWTLGQEDMKDAVTWDTFAPTVAVIMRNPGSKAMLDPVNRMFFKWMDVDNTGTVSIKEYRVFCDSLMGAGNFTEEEFLMCFAILGPQEDDRDGWVVTEESYMKNGIANIFSLKRINPYSFASYGPHSLDPEKLGFHPWTKEPFGEMDVEKIVEDAKKIEAAHKA